MILNEIEPWLGRHLREGDLVRVADRCSDYYGCFGYVHHKTVKHLYVEMDLRFGLPERPVIRLPLDAGARLLMHAQ